MAEIAPKQAPGAVALQTRALRVGIIGSGWMGQVHARAYARWRQHYFDLDCHEL